MSLFPHSACQIACWRTGSFLFEKSTHYVLLNANDVFFSIKPTVAETNAQISVTNEANDQLAFVVVDALGHRVAFFDLMHRDTYFFGIAE